MYVNSSGYSGASGRWPGVKARGISNNPPAHTVMAEVVSHSVSASTAFRCPAEVQATTRQTACPRTNVLNVFSFTFPHLHTLCSSMAHVFIGKGAVVLLDGRTGCVFDFSHSDLASSLNVHDFAEIDVFNLHSWHVKSPPLATSRACACNDKFKSSDAGCIKSVWIFNSRTTTCGGCRWCVHCVACCFGGFT